MRLSLYCSTWAAVLAVAFGVPLAWMLARIEFPGRRMARALCTLSMVLPPVVAGVALFYALGRRGLVGQYLDRWFGITLPFSTAGVIVAQTFVAMPFLVITVEGAFRQVDLRYEEAARTLGGSRWYVFRRVTLPAIRPGLVAGAVLAWARALGEFGATITFAGNFPGRTQTMPLAIYLANEINPERGHHAEPRARRRLVRGAGPAARPVPRRRSAACHDPRGAPRAHPRGLHASTSNCTPKPGEVVALLGPNGAGKSTAFRCLAGLLPLDDGSIELDGQTLDDPAEDVFVSAERRPVAVVFQDYLLFPNLTALENVAFGLRARGMAKAKARARASAWLDRVGLADRAQHRPRALSGGQAQRVALARALATEPRLLLLDEPLAALDAGTRGEVRRDLRRHLTTFDGVRLLVTHDPVDAYALADRVVILEAGRIVQTGTLAEVTAQPRSRYIAELVGVNLITGRAEDGAIVTADRWTNRARRPGRRGRLRRDPTQLRCPLPRRPEGSPRNVWPSRVDRHRPRRRQRPGTPRRDHSPRRRDHAGGSRRPGPADRATGSGPPSRRPRSRPIQPELPRNSAARATIETAVQSAIHGRD